MTDRQKASLIKEAARQAKFYAWRDPELAEFWENLRAELNIKGKETFTLPNSDTPILDSLYGGMMEDAPKKGVKQSPAGPGVVSGPNQ